MTEAMKFIPYGGMMAWPCLRFQKPTTRAPHLPAVAFLSSALCQAPCVCRPVVPLTPSLEDELALHLAGIHVMMIHHKCVQGELHRRPFKHALLLVVSAPGVLLQYGAVNYRRCWEGGCYKLQPGGGAGLAKVSRSGRVAGQVRRAPAAGAHGRGPRLRSGKIVSGAYYQNGD